MVAVPELKTGEEYMITADSFNDVDIAALEIRCNFWRSIAEEIPI